MKKLTLIAAILLFACSNAMAGAAPAFRGNFDSITLGIGGMSSSGEITARGFYSPCNPVNGECFVNVANIGPPADTGVGNCGFDNTVGAWGCWTAGGFTTYGTGSGGGGMIYPDVGIPQSTGTAWGESLGLDTNLTGPFAADTSVPSSRATKSSVDALTAQISSLTARISDLEAISGGDNVVGTGAGVPLLTMIWGTTGVTEPGYFDISQNDGPLLREAYPDAWAKIAEYGIAVSDSAWLAEYAANDNAIGKYSSGDGSTTFRLPVISKRFIRATDTSLPIGTAQGDAIRNIDGSFILGSTIGVQYSTATITNIKGAFSIIDDFISDLTQNASGMNSGSSRAIGFSASNVVPTAEENRPVAIAFTPLLRVGTYVDVGPPEEEGLPLNGSFEKTITANIPENWEQDEWFEGDAVGTLNTADFITGTQSLQVRVNLNTAYYAIVTADYYKCAPGTQVQFSYYAKRIAGTATGTSMAMLRWYKADKTPSDQQATSLWNVPGTPTDWTQYNRQFNPPSDAVFFRIAIGAYDFPGTVLFDDVVITAGSAGIAE